MLKQIYKITVVYYISEYNIKASALRFGIFFRYNNLIVCVLLLLFLFCYFYSAPNLPLLLRLRWVSVFYTFQTAGVGYCGMSCADASF